jgi:hypothetical protein
MKKLHLSLLLLIFSFVVFSQTTSTYTFNDLTVGALNGQDDWVSVKHSAGGGVNQVNYIGPSGWVTGDESLGVFFSNANTNYGEVATRKSTSNFSFDFSQGGTIEVELDVHRNWWGIAFGIGYDADGDGTLLPPMQYETTLPNPNLPTQDGGIYFICTGNDPRPEYKNGIVLPDNTMPVDFDFDYADWTRWRIFIDLEANDQSGSIALFADYGLTGEFVPIAEIQGLNAGLTPGSGDRFDPAMWDAVFFLSSSHGGFDNFTITQTPAGLASQFIDFTEIPDQLIFNQPFAISATCTSGLPITFTVLEGPATVNGNTITLTGETGIVKIQATQEGDDQWQPAPPVTRSFEVVDPAQFPPTVTIRRPYDGTKVYMETLEPVMMLVSVVVEHSDIILVKNMEFSIDGQTIECLPQGNNYFSAIWTPSAFGTFNADLTTIMSGDNSYVESNSFEVTADVEDLSVVSFNKDYQISPSNHVVTGEFIFPTHVGVFDAITAILDMNCAPPNGCDTYDRVANIYAKNIHGDYVEIFKYITSFGVACSDAVDVSEYSSIFQGLVEIKFQVVTWNGSGYLPVLTFGFEKGTPEYNYSDVIEIWGEIFDFGDYANLQPVPEAEWTFNSNTEKASLVVSTTGHNWSSNTAPNYGVNTGNAAEFYEGTHYININGARAFTQHLWPASGSCTPNPAGCQPQNGTWTYPRQGWCPGSIAMVWDWDLTPYIGSPINLFYEFDPTYTDFCHPNYPDCIDGQNNCPNCGAPDNPILNVSAKIVSYSNNTGIFIGNKPYNDKNNSNISVYPNPSDGIFDISSDNDENMNVKVINIATGQTVMTFNWDGSKKTINMKDYAKGAYILNIIGRNGVKNIKLIVK